MSVKKVMGLIALIAVSALLIFGSVLYGTIKTKSTDISQYKPFSKWTGKTVMLDKETVLVAERVKIYEDKNFPYLLLDSLHPDWKYLEERIQLGDYSLIQKFPAGTKFEIEKAVQVTGGVSGNSTPFVFGTAQYNGKSYKTSYQWGTMDIGKRFDKIEKCWQFHRSPWQKQVDTVFYELPEAKWW